MPIHVFPLSSNRYPQIINWRTLGYDDIMLLITVDGAKALGNSDLSPGGARLGEV